MGTWVVISTVISKLKDLSRPQASHVLVHCYSGNVCISETMRNDVTTDR